MGKQGLTHAEVIETWPVGYSFVRCLQMWIALQVTLSDSARRADAEDAENNLVPVVAMVNATIKRCKNYFLVMGGPRAELVVDALVTMTTEVARANCRARETSSDQARVIFNTLSSFGPWIAGVRSLSVLERTRGPGYVEVFGAQTLMELGIEVNRRSGDRESV